MKLCWLASVGILLLGCSTKIPTTQELELKNHIPQSFVNYQANNTPAKSAQKQENSPIERFYMLIDDKPLHSLLDIALERNTNVLTMISRINQAKSQARIDTAALFPTISGNIGSNYTDRRTQEQSLTIRPGTNSVSANLSLSWEIDLFGKLNALRKASKKAYEQAQANLEDAQISLLTEVGTLYFTLRDNAYNLTLNAQVLKNLKEIDSIREQEYQKGLIDLNTYRASRANLITQKNSLENLRYTYEQNKNALLVLLDINADELESKVNFLDSINAVLPNVASFNMNAIPSEVLLARPDVKANIFALHSQLYKTTNAKAARLPTISLSGSIGQVLYSNIASNSLVFQIANSLAMPLLNRASLRESHRIQKELTKEAYYTLQNTINTALGEIENALFDKDSKHRQVANNKVVLSISKQAYQTDRVRAHNGVINTSEFLTNENTHISTQTQYFTSQVNEIIATLTLFKALGGALYVDYGSVDSASKDILDSTNEKNMQKGVTQ